MSQRMLVVGGAGDLGRKRILPALERLGVEVEVVDPRPLPPPPQAPAVRAYARLSDVPSSGQFCGVIVASPNDLHLPHVRWAVERGLPCLCEKPLAHTLAGAQSIRNLAAGPVPLLVAEHYLAKPAGVFLVDHREEVLGRAGFLETVRGRILEPAPPNLGPATPAGRHFWLRDAARAGGGAWIDMGIHLLTVLLSLLPGRPWEVRSAVARGYDEDSGAGESHLAMTATLGSAEVGLEAGRDAAVEVKDLLLEGTAGSVRVDWNSGAVQASTLGAAQTLHEATVAPFGGYLTLLGGFAAVCRGESAAARPGLVTCELAMASLRLAKSVYAHAGLPPRLRALVTR